MLVEKINTNLILEKYREKVISPYFTFSEFWMQVIRVNTNIVHEWEQGTKKMTDHQKQKVKDVTGLNPDQYCKIIKIDD